MQTSRDAQIVAWIGRIGAVGAEHVMRRFGMGRSVVYHRLNTLTRDGLLEHHMVLYGRPGVYTATTEGLRWQRLQRLPLFKVRPGGFEHAWQVAHTAAELHHALPGWDVVGEREIRSIETDRKELFASASVGRVVDRQILHRPDLALLLPGSNVIPIEVELSVKSASRLAAICRGWARARHINRVYYLAAPDPGRALKRAIAATHATDRIRVLNLNDIPTLAAEVCELSTTAFLQR
ncbi:MAG TPA: hypothetical protein VGI26_07990 [Solirubrobacteraceae bacterium]|jgi:hypothetical protein